MGALSLEVFQTGLGKTLSNLVNWKLSLPVARGCNYMTLRTLTTLTILRDGGLWVRPQEEDSRECPVKVPSSSAQDIRGGSSGP